MGGGGFLGLGPAPSPPPAPNYTQAAQVTAQGNLQAAQAATAANRVSQYTPYGSLVYTQDGTDSQGNPMWNATTTLSPVGQQLQGIQDQTSLGLGQTINAQLGNVQNTMGQGFNPNLPGLNYSAGQANLGQVGQGPQFSQAGTAGQAQGVGQSPDLYGVNLQGQAQTGVAGTGMQGWDTATQLLMSRLNPQMAQQAESQKAQLANQGIVPGTQAYENAMRSFNQGQNDLLTQAQLQGAQVQNQMFNQNLQAGQFGNQAVAQNQQSQLNQQQANNTALNQGYQNQIAGTQLGNQALQQNYTNQLAGLGFNNQQAQQGYANTLAAQQQNNAALQQGFANNVTNANLGNAAQQQAYNQAMTNYNLPLNTLGALRTGAQVQNPTFTNVPQQATTAGADILGAQTAQYNSALGASNASAASQAGFNSGLMGLGGTLGAAALLSDIRTKENVVKIGIAENGLPVYIYEYKPEFKNEAGHGKFVGYMAHEVEEVMPEAVITRPDGYKMVNYGVINA